MLIEALMIVAKTQADVAQTAELLVHFAGEGIIIGGNQDRSVGSHVLWHLVENGRHFPHLDTFMGKLFIEFVPAPGVNGKIDAPEVPRKRLQRSVQVVGSARPLQQA